jgi:hypothetical protein
MTGRGATNGHGGLRGAGKAKGRASLKLRKKGQSGNKCKRPKDLDNFGNLLMKEFYKTLQGVMVAQQMVENARSFCRGGHTEVQLPCNL